MDRICIDAKYESMISKFWVSNNAWDFFTTKHEELGIVLTIPAIQDPTLQILTTTRQKKKVLKLKNIKNPKWWAEYERYCDPLAVGNILAQLENSIDTKQCWKIARKTFQKLEEVVQKNT